MYSSSSEAACGTWTSTESLNSRLLIADISASSRDSKVRQNGLYRGKAVAFKKFYLKKSEKAMLTKNMSSMVRTLKPDSTDSNTLD